MTWDGVNERLVAAFHKSAREQVHVRLRVFEDRRLIDVRVWSQDRETEEWRPTAKGIAVPTELYDALLAAIEQVGDDLPDDLRMA